MAALLFSVVAALALLLLPTGAVHEVNGQGVTSDRTVSLWENQPDVAFVLAIPVLLCVLPLVVGARFRRTAAWVSVAALGVFVLLGLLSVGLFFLPAVIVMAIGAVRLGR